ncbi:TVP38/TMEM64 family protein [Corynebacterium alimapuense]|uniref:TVP38/TMEM64 family membrane protein n=1 Tax=Corynebacterium alimapuense TaxID=1576874 RepID=A0A3M8K9H0_9CORY|nr:TVP38/TMEM64 family protein [Corynebacterium alimapuense]RNE49164.1 hypothetical protein C5L39_01920 [Corynebacterium alimapuense]
MKHFGHFVWGLSRDAQAAVRGWSRTRKTLVVIGSVLFLAIAIFARIPSLDVLVGWGSAAGPEFLLAFWLGYVIVTMFPVPRTLLTLASGVLYGPWVGILVSLTATTVSAALSLIVVRKLLGEWMRPRLNHPSVAGINHRLEQRGWLAVASLRMIAAVPFSVLNYAAALSSVPLVAFTLATLVGSTPGTVVTVALGSALTGEIDPQLLVITVALALVGIAGLVVDYQTPVKPVE